MTFLTPWLLYGFAALAVPVVIHLWQRRRVIHVPFSTLRFLKIVAARTSRSAKLENLLLLLLRCLIFALIVAAAARPVASTQSTRLFGGDVPRTIALVIDQSLSMAYRSGGETRLDRARRQAQAVIDDLKVGDQLVVVAATDRARMLVSEPTVDHAVARQAVEGVQQTEARTDFAAALREARKALEKAQRGVKQIFLFTDNQASGWSFEQSAVFDEAWKQTSPKLVVVYPDDLEAVNATVSKVTFESPFAASGAMTRGTATVENHSAAPLQDLIELRSGSEKLAAIAVEVAPGSSAEVPFEFAAPAVVGRWILGAAHLSGDNLPLDDAHYFTLPVYQTPRVLIVESGSGPERARPAFFLRKALAAGSQAAPIQTVSPSDLDDLVVEPFSAVFLAGIPGLSDRASVRLARYIESGGTVVFFPSEQTDFAALARLEWMPAKAGAIRELPTGRLTVFALEPQHPLFTNSWDANTPFPALPQRKMIEWTLNPDARSLLMLGELPFLVVGERGTGRVLIVNASPDRSWGDFPLTSAFLPLVQQIGRLSVSRTGKEVRHRVGDPVPAPASLPREQPLSLKTPGGDVQPLQAGALLLERAEQAGLYEVSSASEGQVHQFAVNVVPVESNLVPIAEERLQGIVAHESVRGVEALRLWLAQSRGMVPLWPLFLLLALLVFAGESVYSNLLARRRSQGDEEHIKTGRLNKRRQGQPFRDAAHSVEPQEVKP